MKKPIMKTLTPIFAVAAVFGLAASVANAATTPVFQYDFPASWDGTGTVVTDLSAALNDGVVNGTPSLDTAVPPGAPVGARSFNPTAGGIMTSAIDLLDNATVFANGGFTYNVSFMWDGTDSTSWGHIQKIIDYAGTESLQLTTSAGSAALQMAFNPGHDSGDQVATVAVSTTILPNTWYDVTMSFYATSMVGSDVAGLAFLQVNGGSALQAEAVKGTYGDTLVRPIGIGQLAYTSPLHLVYFYGDIYNPSVSLGPSIVPEPSTLALGALGGLGMMLLRRRKS